MRWSIGSVAAMALMLGTDAGAQEGPTTRPHEPWVFRSVLDRHARMITIALHEKLWVAYDAQTCSLYRAWPGGVKFTGAVYDLRHGPQPEAEGEAYLSMPEAPKAWLVSRGGQPAQVKPDYTGYTVNGTASVTLHYRLVLDGAAEIRIDETPEVEKDDDGRLFFVRRLTVRAPEGVTVKIPMAAASPVMEPMLERDGDYLLVTAGGDKSDLSLRVALAALQEAKQ